MAGADPLAGLDLGTSSAASPDPTNKKKPPAGPDPLAGLDLGAPSPAAVAAPAAPEVPWFSATGNDKIGEFVGKMGDAATMGLAAKAQDALGFAQGPHGETVAQQVANAGKDIGPIASGVADVAGYGLGAGSLGVGEGIGALATSGIAKGIGENIASRVAGRAIGAGVEGAGSTIVGAAGHDENLTAGDLLKSTLLSAGTAALTPNLGAGSKAKEPSPTAGLNAAKKTAFDPLDTVHYNSSDIQPGFDGVTPSLSSGDRVARSTDLKAAVNDVSQEMKDKATAGGTITADDIAKFQRTVQGAATNPQDALIAKQYSDALTNSLKTARPLTTGSLSPGTNVADAVSAANTAANKAKTSGEIDDWITQAQRNPGKVPDAVDKQITNNPQFYQGGVGDMLRDVANSKPGLMSKIGGKVGYGLANAAIDAAGNYIAGGNPIVGAITGGLGGTILGHGSDQYRAGDLVNKLAAARHFNATGQKFSPESFGKGVPVLGPLTAYATKVPAALGASGWWGTPQPSAPPPPP